MRRFGIFPQDRDLGILRFRGISLSKIRKFWLDTNVELREAAIKRGEIGYLNIGGRGSSRPRPPQSQL